MSVRMMTVADDEADLRLDRWFRRHHPTVTQGTLQKLCRTGQIRVDGHRVDGATRIAPGQTIRVPPLPAATEAAEYRIDHRDVDALRDITLYEDDDIIALDKPAGLPSQGGPGIVRHVDGMAASLKDARGRRPLLVHRLDRDTSGLLVLAKGPAAASKLANSFRTRAVHKIYWAVVVGRPDPTEGVIDAALARLGGGGGALTVIADRDEEDAAASRTEYRTLDSAARKMAWLELEPLTGRTHQLRVHCEAIGTPILGDPKYGLGRSRMEGFADRLHLHARTLTFPHPSGGTIRLTAGLPPHMRDTFQTLGFVAPSREPPFQRG